MNARSVSLVSSLVLLTSCASAVAAEESICLDSELAFETSALERIVEDPRQVLQDEERFWEDEPAQKYTTIWADHNGFSISRKKWRGRISGFAELDEGARASSSLMRTTQAILDGREEFLERALPHVCSFLPEATDTGVPVYFTAFIPPRAFVTGGIIINVNASYWKGNADNILNTLTHEIWHVGYSRLRETRSETPLEHEPLYGMLEQLQNEGTATYVAYRARDTFPAPDEVDFRSLDDPRRVRLAIEEVNSLFQRVGSVSEKRLGKLSWKTGVDGRAYYIAGAHMAQVIDMNSGREGLIRTVTSGPVSFVETYNDLVSEERRIEYPDVEAVAQRANDSGSPVLIVIIAVAVLGLGMALLVLRGAMR